MKWVRFSKEKEKETWHRWFAWYPVTVGHYPDGAEKRVWLEWVERCGEMVRGLEDCYWEWSYRPLTKAG